MELIETFSEQAYYSLQDLYQEYNASIADAMWKEIIAYRKPFRKDLSFFSSSIYIVLCKQVMMKTILLQEQVFIYIQRSTKDISFTKKEQLLLELHLDFEDPSELRYTCSFLEIDDVLHAYAILTSKLPFLLRIFLIMELEFDQKRELLFLACAKQYALKLLPMLKAYPREKISQNDKTSAYLSFLAFFDLQIKEGVVSCNHACIAPEKLLPKALVQRFPQVKMEAAQFYVNHREVNHYYTIAQYMEECGVCYETARKSMDHFVAMKWYHKRKQGKKYVYFIHES